MWRYRLLSFDSGKRSKNPPWIEMYLASWKRTWTSISYGTIYRFFWDHFGIYYDLFQHGVSHFLRLFWDHGHIMPARFAGLWRGPVPRWGVGDGWRWVKPQLKAWRFCRWSSRRVIKAMNSLWLKKGKQKCWSCRRSRPGFYDVVWCCM